MNGLGAALSSGAAASVAYALVVCAGARQSEDRNAMRRLKQIFVSQQSSHRPELQLGGVCSAASRFSMRLCSAVVRCCCSVILWAPYTQHSAMLSFHDHVRRSDSSSAVLSIGERLLAGNEP